MFFMKTTDLALMEIKQIIPSSSIIYAFTQYFKRWFLIS